MEDSRKAFRYALEDLALLTGNSMRELFRRIDKSAGYLGALRAGERQPSPQLMEDLAHAAGVHPRYFAEYREYMARQRAAELAERIGLDAVLDALHDAEKH